MADHGRRLFGDAAGHTIGRRDRSLGPPPASSHRVASAISGVPSAVPPDVALVRSVDRLACESPASHDGPTRPTLRTSQALTCSLAEGRSSRSTRVWRRTASTSSTTGVADRAPAMYSRPFPGWLMPEHPEPDSTGNARSSTPRARTHLHDATGPPTLRPPSVMADLPGARHASLLRTLWLII